MVGRLRSGAIDQSTSVAYWPDSLEVGREPANRYTATLLYCYTATLLRTYLNTNILSALGCIVTPTSKPANPVAGGDGLLLELCSQSLPSENIQPAATPNTSNTSNTSNISNISNTISAMALDHLPIELLCFIMSSLDSPQDLYSLIKASPVSLQAFLASRRITLSSVIRNALLPDAIHHALALLHIPRTPLGADHPDREEVKDFLDQYLQPNSWSFPTDLSSIISLTRLIPLISRSIDRYFDFAMRTLGTFQEHNGSWPLSPTERARLQRAHLRFEIYCQICPILEYNPMEPFLPPAYQFHHFLGKLEPWEVEEISCIHEYFATIIGRYIMDFEDHFIQTVLGNTHLRAPPNHNLQEDRVSNREISENDREDMEFFDALDITDLCLFSTDSKARLRKVAAYMASLGLKFLENLMSSDTDRRWDLIRRNSPLTRGFLPEALEFSPRNPAKTIPPEGDFTDDSSRPSKGWFDFKGLPYDLYFSILCCDFTRSLLRVCGYVFWDSRRVLHPTVFKALKAVKGMDKSELSRFHNPTVGQSAEKQLEGFQLPKSEMLKIVEQFGMTWTL
ncbi:hypothetical protein E0Z10_g633 [Xylaria hypoxylon]|uniref:F-box domain-containing protein n=1 Tax=Xylaria hypoxylon TaxID=37992 RepID=A0A4Z0YVX0_9PEZI|nr:hypothetical protein E0Z10_g633 [Xylaria hypoxylon]